MACLSQYNDAACGCKIALKRAHQGVRNLIPRCNYITAKAAIVKCMCMIKWNHMVFYSCIMATWRLVNCTIILATWRPGLHECEIHDKEIPALWALPIFHFVVRAVMRVAWLVCLTNVSVCAVW